MSIVIYKPEYCIMIVPMIVLQVDGLYGYWKYVRGSESDDKGKPAKCLHLYIDRYGMPNVIF